MHKWTKRYPKTSTARALVCHGVVVRTSPRRPRLVAPSLILSHPPLHKRLYLLAAWEVCGNTLYQPVTMQYQFRNATGHLVHRQRNFTPDRVVRAGVQYANKALSLQFGRAVDIPASSAHARLWSYCNAPIAEECVQ